MEFWVGVIISAVAMAIYHWLMNRIFIDGTLQIDKHDPNKDVYQIHIDDLNRLDKKKRIVLAVDKNATLSQK